MARTKTGKYSRDSSQQLNGKVFSEAQEQKVKDCLLASNSRAFMLTFEIKPKV